MSRFFSDDAEGTGLNAPASGQTNNGQMTKAVAPIGRVQEIWKEYDKG